MAGFDSLGHDHVYIKSADEIPDLRELFATFDALDNAQAPKKKHFLTENFIIGAIVTTVATASTILTLMLASGAAHEQRAQQPIEQTTQPTLIAK